MKISIEVTKISPALSKRYGCRNITVHIHEDNEGTVLQSMDITVFVEGEVSDIEEIKASAIEKAKRFISDVSQTV